MLTKANGQFLKQTQTEIQSGRRCDPGDFYLVHRLGLESEKPFSEEATYIERNEYVEPTIEVMKGDEREVIATGLLEIGDIICTFMNDEGIDLSDVSEAVYLNVTYYVKQVYKKGLGKSYTRQQLFCGKEK